MGADTTTVLRRPECPRCHRNSTVPLAREGDKQRHQCISCGENFCAFADLGGQPISSVLQQAADGAAEPQQGPGVSHAPIAPPEPGELPGAGGEPAGRCPKCRKPYYRLGKRYDEHVASCDGTPFVEQKPRAKPPEGPQPAPAAPVPPGTAKAIDLSIEALRLQRSALEAEIRGIDGAIQTLQKVRALGGEAGAPFAVGA